MKVEERQIDVFSTLSGEKIGMSIDESALSHVMAVLTDLYSDPEMAVIREYSTNAFDSHVEAGVKRPIEVTLPTPLSQYFRVRDFGVGMDIDDIRNIYSRYGTSTKRNSNDVVGMLGLGCKSALTYTDQFTIVAIRDGVCMQVSVSRDADGASSMTIVSQEPTNEPTGVEIIVPVKLPNRFEEKANDFFKFWQNGSVLVNGKEPAKIGDEAQGMWIADDIFLTRSIHHSVVVMGNVAYPVLDNNHFGTYHYQAVMFVDIGSVSFTPSRESLQATNRTKETLEHLRGRVKNERDAAFQKMIDDAKTKPEAYRVYAETINLGYGQKGVWKGIDIPSQLELPRKHSNPIPKTPPPGSRYVHPVVDDKDKFLTLASGRYGRRKGYREPTVAFKSIYDSSALFFVNFDANEFSPHKRAKLDQWLSKKNFSSSPQMFVFTNQDKIPDADWLTPGRIFDWSEVAAEKLPKNTNTVRGDGRPTGSYHATVAGISTRQLLAKDIDTSKPIFWQRGSYIYGPDVKIINELHPDATIVGLPGNRIDKFKRDFPTAVNTHDVVVGVATKWAKSLTSEDRLRLGLERWSHTTTLGSFDASHVDDPVLVTLINAVKDGKKRNALNEIFQKYRNYISEIPLHPLIGDDYFGNNYPLVCNSNLFYGNSGRTATAKEHAYAYMNMLYAKSKKNSTEKEN